MLSYVILCYLMLSYVIDISRIVHHHYSNLLFIIIAHPLIFITLIKV